MLTLLSFTVVLQTEILHVELFFFKQKILFSLFLYLLIYFLYFLYIYFFIYAQIAKIICQTSFRFKYIYITKDNFFPTVFKMCNINDLLTPYKAFLFPFNCLFTVNAHISRNKKQSILNESTCTWWVINGWITRQHFLFEFNKKLQRPHIDPHNQSPKFPLQCIP